MRTAICAAIIQERRKERKILLVKKRTYWILPGGKPNGGEGDLECLCREVAEELSGTQLCNIRQYGDFKGDSPHKKDIVIARVYLADIKGRLNRPSQEISDVRFASRNTRINISDLTYLVIGHLRYDGLL